MDEKTRIRSEMRMRRRQVPADERARISHAICEDLLQRVEVADVISARRKICVYLATKDEIDLGEFINVVFERGGEVVAPRWAGGKYALAELPEHGELAIGPMGVREPSPECKEALPGEVGLWIVPGLAFAADGSRLGYGGGWYDRLLAEADPLAVKIGVAYAFQMVDCLPHESHDRLLDGFATAG